MSSDKKLKPETLAISAGRPAPEPDGALNTPIALNSTFHAGGPIGYGRYGNETWTSLETAISALEGGQTLVFASGQAAAMPTSADTFYDLIYALRARYRSNARWVTSKLLLSALRKYKDSTGQYLWQPSLAIGQPDSFMGYAIAEAEDMPVVGAGNFPIAFGDFREGYLIADRVGLRVTRDEITVPGFVQWYVRRRLGGRLRNTEAIKLLRISAT